MTALAPAVESFFTEYLTAQRGASPHTIASYRDTLRLLFAWIRAVVPAPGRPTSTSPMSTPRLSAASSPCSRKNGTTPGKLSASGSPPSTRCSGTRPCATPSTPR